MLTRLRLGLGFRLQRNRNAEIKNADTKIEQVINRLDNKLKNGTAL